MKTSCIGLIKLKDYQEIILNETLDSLRTTGEGAISLFTGGGKSFIGLKIALMYLERYEYKDVLWLGTNSANKNVYSSVIKGLPSDIRERIHMKSYEQIWNGDDTLEVEPYQTCFIVFDESHRSLTRLSTETILDIKNTFKCDRIAMSATQRRTSGLESFRILTPRAIWYDYNCNWAADNEVINKIVYLVSNTKISKFDLSEFEAYKEIADVNPDIKDRCKNLELMLSNYKFNFGNDVYNIIFNSGMSLDASNGARHVIFFSSITELESYSDTVYDIFSRLYPGSEVRVFDYHSKITQSEAKRVLDEGVNSEASPNTVDVIITVDKGSESIHPRGIKSVIMFRHTSSYIKFIQQMGRGITLKGFSSDESYIFDFSDGYVSLLRGNTIAYGRRATDNRVDDLKIDTLESLEAKLKKALSSNIKIRTTFATQELRELSTRLNELRDEVLNKDKATFLQSVVKEVKAKFGTEWRAMPSFENLKNLYLKGLDTGEIKQLDRKYTDLNLGLSVELTLWVRQISKLIIQESFDTDSESYKILIEMGHLIYLIDSNSDDENYMNTIDNILAYKKRMASNGVRFESSTKPYKDLLNLKKLNFHDVLSVYVCTYARHNDLDLSADDIYIEEIRRLSMPEDKDAFLGYNKEIKVANILNEILNSDIVQSKHNNIPPEYKIRSELDISDDVDKVDDAQLMWSVLQAWHLINGVNHKTAYANFIRHKIEEQYKKELRFRTLSLSVESDGLRLITILNNYANTDIVIKGTFQEYLFKHIGFKELSLIEVMILRIYGIKTNSKYKKLLDRTGWMETYNKALEGDTVALVQLEHIDRNHLDDYRKKLISSKSFRQAKVDQYQDMKTEILLKKAKGLSETDKLLQSELSKALGDNRISSMQLILVAFPDYLHEELKELLEISDEQFAKAIIQDKLNRKTTFGKIYNAASLPTSCIPLVLRSILKVKGLDSEIYAKASMICKEIS